MNNINRQQQIPVAFNQEKAMTYGAAITASNRRDVALSNLNRMSLATNPWTRKIAQGTLSNTWVDYQNQLVAKASGTEALTQAQKARPTAIQQRDIQAIDYSLDPGDDIGSVFSGSEHGDVYAYAGEVDEPPGGGGGGGAGAVLRSMSFQSEFMRSMQRELGSGEGGEFNLGERLDVGREARQFREGEMSGGSRAALELPPEYQGGFAEDLSRLAQLSPDDILGGMTEGGMGFVSREMYGEALEAERRGRQDILQRTNPLSLIYLEDSNVMDEIEDLGQFARESLEQGVEQDFDSRDVSLSRVDKFRVEPQIQNLPSLGDGTELVIQQVELVRNRRSKEMGKRFGLPEYQLAAERGEVEMLRQSLVRTTETFGKMAAGGGGAEQLTGGTKGGEPYDMSKRVALAFEYNSPPEGTSEQLIDAYKEWIERQLRGFNKVPINAWKQFLSENQRSFFS
jgi:hypothetical protein